jgi:hypothetical protein
VTMSIDIINPIKDALEKEGFEFYQTNGIRDWYKKFSPELGGNWYGYAMWNCEIIHDIEMEWLKISIQFASQDYDTIFEGWCPDIDSLYTIMKLVRIRG